MNIRNVKIVNLIWAALILCSILNTSCSKSVFTQSIRNRINQMDPILVEELQYYNGKQIVLHRISAKEEYFDVSKGKVKYKNGFYNYYRYINKKTPAVSKINDESGLKVFFEKNKEAYLLFVNNNDYYRLENQIENGEPYVIFENQKYAIYKGISSPLKFRKNGKIRAKTKTDKVKGVKLKDKNYIEN